MPTICCPNCNKSYQVDSSVIGHKARCHSCGIVFVAEEQQEEDIIDLGPQQFEEPKQSQENTPFYFSNLILADGMEFSRKQMRAYNFVIIIVSVLVVLIVNFLFPPSVAVWPLLPFAALVFIIKRSRDYKTWKKIRNSPHSDVELFCKAKALAEKGNQYAQNQVGICYVLGIGTSTDCYEALKWFKKADQEGSYNAQCNLGWCYYYGRGVEKNYSKAVSCFKRSSNLPEAQYNLGVCFYNGNGVSKNNEKAINWWHKSFEQGCDEARDALKKLEVL